MDASSRADSQSRAESGEILRLQDLQLAQLERAWNAIEEITDDRIDMVLVRGAFPREALDCARRGLEEREPEWLRLNEGLPSLDIGLLGWPSFPTFKAPEGPTPEEHLAANDRYRPVIDGLFGPRFDLSTRLEEVLGRLSGGRPLRLPPAPAGRSYLPYTVRSFSEGVGTLAHVDDHFHLPFFRELVPHLDTTTLVSFFLVLQAPEAGGELSMYDLKKDRDEAPKDPGGFWDQKAIETGYGRTRVVPGEGDLVVFSAGRCFHKVEPVVGPRRRVTLGGLMALDRERTSVWYWA